VINGLSQAQARPQLRATVFRIVLAALPVALLTVMAMRLVGDARTDSLTVDEPLYIQSGLCALTNRVIDLDPTNPPIFKLLAATGVLLFDRPPTVHCKAAANSSTDWRAQSVFSTDPASIQRLAFAARLPIVAIGLLLALVVFGWARALFGYPAGLLAMGMVAFEPTVLAHSHLATGDVTVAFGLIVCLAAHWAWTGRQQRRWLLVAGIGLGWALLSKVSALELIPLLAVIELMLADGSWFARIRRSVGSVLVVGATAWATICLVYLPFTNAWGQYRWTAPLALIAPPQWFDSLTYQLHHAQVGHPAYLNGHLATAHGFWIYFLEAFALKTTLGFLLLVFVGAALTVVGRHRISLLYLWLPIVGIIVVATLGGIDIGVRYILPVYPLAAVASGILVSGVGARVPLRRLTAGVAFAAIALASVAHAPNDIGYFNELAGSNPARYLSDSNLDWGQDGWRLKSWWDANGRPAILTSYFGGLPLESYGISSVDKPSQARFFVISVEHVTASNRWLLNVEPGERVGTSIWIYRITG
jgi:hypothetical protein